MVGKFELERVWRSRHVNVPGDPLLYFPESEILKTAEVAEILEPDIGAPNVPLDEVEWLLLHYKGKFTLFVRGYQDPGEQGIDQTLKIPYLNLLRYKTTAAPGTSELVWDLTRKIRDLDSMSSYYRSRWQKRAVLAIRKGNNAGEYKLQVLCREPYVNAAGFCDYCCDPYTEMSPVVEVVGRLLSCNSICPARFQ